jgi:hypothetical protein
VDREAADDEDEEDEAAEDEEDDVDPEDDDPEDGVEPDEEVADVDPLDDVAAEPLPDGEVDGVDGVPVVGGVVVDDPDGLGEDDDEDDDGEDGEDDEDDGDEGDVVGGLVVGLVVGCVVGVVVPPLPLDGGAFRSGPWVGPSTEPYTRVAWNSRVQRTGVSRTSRPVRGASTIRPLPAYIATW